MVLINRDIAQVAHTFKFSSSNIGKTPGKINFNILYLNIIINEAFSFLLGTKFLESSVCFQIGAHLKLDKQHFKHLSDTQLSAATTGNHADLGQGF